MKIKTIMSIIAVFLLLSLSSQAIEYYIDENIYLDNTGSASITGEANIDLLKYIKPDKNVIKGETPELTLKKDRYWLFQYETEQNLSSIIIKLNLPKNTVINHIDTNLKINIENTDQGIQIKFLGSNKPLKIKLQYYMSDHPTKLIGEINNENGQEKAFYETVIILEGIIILIFIVMLIFILTRKKKKSVIAQKTKNKKTAKKHKSNKIKKKGEAEIDHEKITTIRPTLNETQLRILDALIERKGICSQSIIQHMTNIPKSSLSRNIDIMHKKNIIVKYYTGTRNNVKLHPSFYKGLFYKETEE
ncbi:helix-turn-helix transcriptional regulator [Nanoarchaeota archaeon]